MKCSGQAGSGNHRGRCRAGKSSGTRALERQCDAAPPVHQFLRPLPPTSTNCDLKNFRTCLRM